MPRGGVGLGAAQGALVGRTRAWFVFFFAEAFFFEEFFFGFAPFFAFGFFFRFFAEGFARFGWQRGRRWRRQGGLDRGEAGEEKEGEDQAERLHR